MKTAIATLLLFVIVFSCKTKSGDTEIEVLSDEENTIKTEVVEGDFAGGTLLRITDFPSEYIPPREVDIWLPKGYDGHKKHAVLYMHDGQMLFDDRTTWNNQEWGVDEVATLLMSNQVTQDFIVVAPHNITHLRHSEYFPQKPFESLAESVRDSVFNQAKQDNFKFDRVTSDNYLSFLVRELKPYIDTHYEVLTRPAQTFVAGSSMGGLISMYAVCEYPEVFGGAACLSTHWPGGNPNGGDVLANSFFDYMETHVPSPQTHKIYFDYGTETLDEFYPRYAKTVDAIFEGKGYDKSNYRNLKFEGADHSELSWQKRLEIPLTFLLGKKD